MCSRSAARAEMQFLRNRNEVGQLAQLHAADRRAGLVGVAYQSSVISRGPKSRTSVYSTKGARPPTKESKSTMSPTEASSVTSQTSVRGRPESRDPRDTGFRRGPSQSVLRATRLEVRR